MNIKVISEFDQTRIPVPEKSLDSSRRMLVFLDFILSTDILLTPTYSIKHHASVFQIKLNRVHRTHINNIIIIVLQVDLNIHGEKGVLENYGSLPFMIHSLNTHLCIVVF